jgi:hypothetical protein
MEREPLRDVEERKSIRAREGGGKTVERECHRRGCGRACIASQALVPAESVVCPLCSREYLIPRRKNLFWRGRCSDANVYRFATHDGEKGAPDLRTWPILPKHRKVRKGFRYRVGSVARRDLIL